MPHCSGVSSGQWRQLGEMPGADYGLVAPEHGGCDRTGPWTDDNAFTLADEAARTRSIVDGADRKAHLIGYSYGGVRVFTSFGRAVRRWWIAKNAARLKRAAILAPQMMSDREPKGFGIHGSEIGFVVGALQAGDPNSNHFDPRQPGGRSGQPRSPSRLLPTY